MKISTFPFYLVISGLLLAVFLFSCTPKNDKNSKKAATENFLSDLEDGTWNQIAPGGETVCADGSDFYFLVRKGDPEKVVLYFQGGGACWDAYTCANPIDTIQPDFYLNRIAKGEIGESGIFDFDNPQNPVADWTVVAIPYCTGDLHLGDNIASYALPESDSFKIFHKGSTNTEAVLEWMASQSFDPSKIFLCGASAGGYGSIAYAEDVYNQFEKAKVYQLTDCSVLVNQNGSDRYDPWNAKPLTRYGIEGADDLINTSFQKVGLVISGDRIVYSQINSTFDEVMFYFYLVTEEIKEPGPQDMSNFAQPRLVNISGTNSKLDNFFMFSTDFGVNEQGLTPHTFLGSDRLYEAEENGKKLIDWLTDLVNDRDAGDVMAKQE